MIKPLVNKAARDRTAENEYVNIYAPHYQSLSWFIWKEVPNADTCGTLTATRGFSISIIISGLILWLFLPAMIKAVERSQKRKDTLQHAGHPKLRR